MPFRQRLRRCDLCEAELTATSEEFAGLNLCGPCRKARNARGLIARGLHVQTVEEMTWDSSHTRSLGATDFQVPLSAEFRWEGWRSRRRRVDLQTGDPSFDDAVLVVGEGEILRRLLSHEPVRLAIRKLAGRVRIDSGTVTAWCARLEDRLALTVLTWGLSLAARASSALPVESEVLLPWLRVLSNDTRALAISGDRVEPQHIAGVRWATSLTLSDLVLTSSDLTPITTLTELETLRLVRVAEVRALEPLGRMLWLKGLALVGCPIDDIAPLASLTNLERLDLSHTQVSDLTPLARLLDLRELRLSGTALDEASLAFLRERLPTTAIVLEDGDSDDERAGRSD